MMNRILTLLAVLALAACQLIEPAATETGAPAAPTANGDDAKSPLILEQECKAAGGRMVVGLAGPQCATREPDAGKACSDSAQCSGLCLAESKTCSPVTPFFGCHEILEGGKPVTICID